MMRFEIVRKCAFWAPERIEELRDKELIPNMMMRRRLTRNAKMLICLADELGARDGRIVYGSNYGELKESLGILESIFAHASPSPTDFQNSVYNTPSAYVSILSSNRSEILCVSDGDESGDAALRTAAVKAMDGDEILVAVCESFALEQLRSLNACGAYGESAVGFVIRASSAE
jgi:hypothetical protein